MITLPRPKVITVMNTFTGRKLWEYLCNCTLVLFFLFFAFRMLIDFHLTHRVSSLLVMAFETVAVYFVFSRPLPRKSNASVYDWTVALAGSFIGALLRPSPGVHDTALFLAVQLSGMCISLFALFSLNRSFGLVAANRGVKTGGPYGVVRHPIYAGYFLSVGAFVVQNMTVANVAIYILFVTLEILRLISEERVLSEDPAYLNYTRRIRWRVLPFVY
jgi:protein-S-isoprenylcysteine O-methyltransferase Ste14